MFLTLVPGHLLALEGTPATITSTLAAASAVGLFALGEVIERGRWSEADPRGDDPVAFGIATLALANGLTLLAVKGQAQNSIYLLLLIVGASYFIRSARWLLPFIGLTLVGGASTVALFVEDRDGLDSGFATCFALGLSAMLHAARTRFLKSEAHARAIETERIHAALEQRQQTLEKLQNAEARSTAVIEASPDPVMLVDHQDRITEANEAAVEAFGYARDELIGRTLADTIVPERLREAHLLGVSRYLDSREPILIGQRVRLPARRADGSEFSSQVTLREAYTEGSSPVFAGFISDLTERESAEQALHEARERAEEANRAKSQFLARMSHEIRTSLNAIVGLTNLAIADLPQGRVRDLLKKSHGAGEYLSAVLGDTLDLSKVEAGHLALEQRPLCPRRLLQETCDFLAILASERGLDLIIQIDADVPDWIVGDATRIRQIVTNLVDNAIKFTHQGWVRVSMQTRGDRLHLTVEDTGVGVPATLKRRIFEEFEQGRPSDDDTQAGAGLGLTISRKLAHLMGGIITHEDRAGGGSRFSFVLPWVGAESRPPAIQRPAVGRVGVALPRAVERAAIRESLSHEAKLDASLNVTFQGSILIVEDNEINQIVLAETLRRDGLTVEVANDGYAAVEMLERNDFDGVLMDISMPGMDGFETLELIRSLPNRKTVPVVAVSAYATQDMRDRAIASGFDGFVPKPIDLEEIRRVLSRRPAGQGEGEGDPSEGPRAFDMTEAAPPADVIDLMVLRRHTEGDRNLIRRLSKIFDESYPKTLQSIADAVATGAWEQIRRPLHKLKGTLADIGGAAALELVSALSRDGRAEDALAAERDLARLQSILRATSERLAEIATEGENEN
jgi:PAS domain S-box-containing protein